jgi:hypothetical protein
VPGVTPLAVVEVVPFGAEVGALTEVEAVLCGAVLDGVVCFPPDEPQAAAASATTATAMPSSMEGRMSVLRFGE